MDAVKTDDNENLENPNRPEKGLVKILEDFRLNDSAILKILVIVTKILAGFCIYYEPEENKSKEIFTNSKLNIQILYIRLLVLNVILVEKELL